MEANLENLLDIRVGKMTILSGGDDIGILSDGHKLEADFERWDEETEDYKSLASAHIYLLDEKDGDLFIQADEHSQLLCDRLSDVSVVEPYSFEWNEVLERIDLTRGERVTYLDGETHSTYNVCGRVAVLVELAGNLTEKERLTIYSVLSKKLFDFYCVNFILTNKELYYPADLVLPFPEPLNEEEESFNIQMVSKYWKQNIADFKLLGFKKTGQSTYVLNKKY